VMGFYRLSGGALRQIGRSDVQAHLLRREY
jgi:hypothetical protein